MADLNIITLNVNGITQLLKRQKMFEYLRTLRADIVCLQETHGHDNHATNNGRRSGAGQATGAHALPTDEESGFY